MALAIYTYDLPLGQSARREYERGNQERIVQLLHQPGVRELRAYRHPLGITPQVMVQIEFDGLSAVEHWHDSHQYREVLADLVQQGCRNILVDVWDSSPVVPTPLQVPRATARGG